MQSFSDIIRSTEQELERVKEEQFKRAPDNWDEDPIKIAKEDLSQKLTLPEIIRDDLERAKVLFALGDLDLNMNKFKDAGSHLKEALDLVDEKLEPGLYAGILKFYTDTQAFKEDLTPNEEEQLLINYVKSGNILLHVGEKQHACSAFFEASRLEQSRDNLKQAEQYACQALDLARELNLSWGIQKVELHLGKVLFQDERAEDALPHASSGLLHLLSLQKPDLPGSYLADAYELIGDIHTDLNNIPDARAAYINVVRNSSTDSQQTQRALERLDELG